MEPCKLGACPLHISLERQGCLMPQKPCYSVLLQAQGIVRQPVPAIWPWTGAHWLHSLVQHLSDWKIPTRLQHDIKMKVQIWQLHPTYNSDTPAHALSTKKQRCCICRCQGQERTAYVISLDKASRQYIDNSRCWFLNGENHQKTCLTAPTSFIFTVVAGADNTKKLCPLPFVTAFVTPVESNNAALGFSPWVADIPREVLAATTAWRIACKTDVDSRREGSPLALLDITPLGLGESCTGSQWLWPSPLLILALWIWKWALGFHYSLLVQQEDQTLNN